MFSNTVAFSRCGFSVTLSISAQNMAIGYDIEQIKYNISIILESSTGQHCVTHSEQFFSGVNYDYV